MTCIDLKSKIRFSPLMGIGAGYARRQIHFLPTHGLHSLASFPNLRRSLQRRQQNPNISLCGTTPRHGVCSINLSTQLTRGRNVPSRRAAQAVSLGHPQFDFAQQLGSRQQHSRLADLRRLRSTPHPTGQTTISGRRFRSRPRRYRLRFGRHHYRFMPFAFSLGKVSSPRGR